VSEQDTKPTGTPRWWLNTYFLFGIMLVVVSILGFLRGSDFIRDPGQPDNASLAWWYLFAAALFFVNGIVSHQATLTAHQKAGGANA
jgi:hypothetical protein